MLDILYSQIARARRRYYQRRPHLRRRLTAPVISIGNLTVGGSGKTPLAVEIARLLVELGERPSILSRGYAREIMDEGVVVVSDGTHVLTDDVARSGDEPLMAARMVARAAVLVSSSRYVAGRVAETNLGCTVHVLDDGFQHFDLMRDVDLLVAPDTLDDTRTLPFGRFREPLDAAAAADALLVETDALTVAETRVSSPHDRAEALRPPPAAAARLRVPMAFEFSRRITGPLADRPAYAFAGIARPNRFYADLEKAGWRLTGRRSFGDHHHYADREVREIVRAATDSGAQVILTTEKDLVRLGSDPRMVRGSDPLSSLSLSKCASTRGLLSGSWTGCVPFVRRVALHEARAARGNGAPQASAGERVLGPRDKRMRQLLEYVAVKSVAIAVRPFPLSVVRRAGEAFGLMFYSVDRVHRRIAIANLQVAFPKRSDEQCRAVARSMFQHFGRLLLELLKYSSLSNEKQLALVEWEGEERVRLALAQGKGILFCTGHFGFWEQQALAHALKFEPMAVMARPLDNPKLHDLLERIRTSNGNLVLYRRGAVRKALRLLAEGKGVGVLIDQHMTSPDAIYVDFFGRPASTTSMLAALAMRTGAPVIPLFAFPVPGGRYRMIYEHPVEPPRSDAPDAVREFTQRCTDVLEMHVRRHPELWLWMHRRWRDAPGPALDAAPGMFPSAKADLETDA